MPWTPEEMKKKSKKLGITEAVKASRVANAILRRGGDEGVAIATGLARAKGRGPKRKGQPK